MTLPGPLHTRGALESVLRILLRHRFTRDGLTRALIRATVKRLRRMTQ
jgi:hypothetical protein